MFFENFIQIENEIINKPLIINKTSNIQRDQMKNLITKQSNLKNHQYMSYVY